MRISKEKIIIKGKILLLREFRLLIGGVHSNDFGSDSSAVVSWINRFKISRKVEPWAFANVMSCWSGVPRIDEKKTLLKIKLKTDSIAKD